MPSVNSCHSTICKVLPLSLKLPAWGTLLYVIVFQVICSVSLQIKKKIYKKKSVYDSSSQLIRIQHLSLGTYLLAALNEFIYGNYSIFVFVHFLFRKNKDVRLHSQDLLKKSFLILISLTCWPREQLGQNAVMM